MKSPANPYIRRIVSLVGDRDASHALRTFVDSHRSPGETLHALARKLGVINIVEENLPFEGGLFQLPDGQLAIKLNARSPIPRKRFTLAHEIAHLLLKTVPAFRATQRADQALERTCDLIAAELLMPTVEAADFVRSLGAPSPESLKAVASRYTASLRMAAIRVHDDLKLWRTAIGFWEMHPQLKTRWFVGPRRWDATIPDSYSLELAMSADRAVQTNELWRRGAFSDPVSLNLLRIGHGHVLGLVGFVN
jgi:hypothetical protein